MSTGAHSNRSSIKNYAERVSMLSNQLTGLQFEVENYKDVKIEELSERVEASTNETSSLYSEK
jgi:hypothetical protein